MEGVHGGSDVSFRGSAGADLNSGWADLHQDNDPKISSRFSTQAFDSTFCISSFNSTDSVNTPKTKEPNRFSAFIKNSPKLRLVLGGAVVAAGVATAFVGGAVSAVAGVGVGVGVSLLTSSVLTPVGGTVVGGAAGAAVALAGVIASMAVSVKVMSVGDGIIRDAKHDIKEKAEKDPEVDPSDILSDWSLENIASTGRARSYTD